MSVNKTAFTISINIHSHNHFSAKSDHQLVMSFQISACNNWTPNERIFMKSDIGERVENLSGSSRVIKIGKEQRELCMNFEQST
jgi:hypothetical protein